MAATAEEVRVIAWHLGVVASLAGLFAVAEQTGLFIKSPNFPMGMCPFRTLVGLWFGLLMASLALVLGMAVQAHPLIDPLGFTAMGLLEVGTAVPVGQFLTADVGVAESTIIWITTDFPNFREEGSMIASQVVGDQHAGRGLLVTLHTGFGILSDRSVVEIEFIHFFRLHDCHIHPGFFRKLLLGIGVAEGAGIIRLVDLHLVAGRADIMVRHSGFPLGTDRMAISTGNPLIHDVSLVCELQEPGSVGRLGGFEDGGRLDQS